MEDYRYDTDYWDNKTVNGVKKKDNLGNFVHIKNNDDGQRFYGLSNAKRPTDTVIYGDTGSNGTLTSWYFDAPEFKEGDQRGFSRRHGGMGNALFFDGHVQSLSKAEAAGCGSAIQVSWE